MQSNLLTPPGIFAKHHVVAHVPQKNYEPMIRKVSLVGSCTKSHSAGRLICLLFSIANDLWCNYDRSHLSP